MCYDQDQFFYNIPAMASCFLFESMNFCRVEKCLVVFLTKSLAVNLNKAHDLTLDSQEDQSSSSLVNVAGLTV